MNDTVHWWFTFVTLLLYSPLIIGCAFYVRFFTSDNSTTRTLIKVACILIIVSLCLVCTWYLCYFIWIYKRKAFISGWGDPRENPYTENNKKVFLFTFLGETVLLVCFYTYFLCVTQKYQDCMTVEEKEEEGSGSKKSEKAATEKDKSSEKKESAKAESAKDGAE